MGTLHFLQIVFLQINTCYTCLYVLQYIHQEVVDTKPKELLKILKADGWTIARIRGSHYILEHPTKAGHPTIPMHNTDLKPGTFNSILKQAGLK